MRRRENNSCRKWDLRLHGRETHRAPGRACHSKQEVTVEPKVQAKPKTIREKIAGILTGKK